MPKGQRGVISLLQPYHCHNQARHGLAFGLSFLLFYLIFLHRQISLLHPLNGDVKRCRIPGMSGIMPQCSKQGILKWLAFSFHGIELIYT